MAGHCLRQNAHSATFDKTSMSSGAPENSERQKAADTPLTPRHSSKCR
jgi:hypothetical protein